MLCDFPSGKYWSFQIPFAAKYTQVMIREMKSADTRVLFSLHQHTDCCWHGDPQTLLLHSRVIVTQEKMIDECVLFVFFLKRCAVARAPGRQIDQSFFLIYRKLWWNNIITSIWQTMFKHTHTHKLNHTHAHIQVVFQGWGKALDGSFLVLNSLKRSHR